MPSGTTTFRQNQYTSMAFQLKPNKASWRIWNLFLNHLHSNGHLHKPLGKWIHQPHQEWVWYSTDDASTIYKYQAIPQVGSHGQLRSVKTWYSIERATEARDLPFPLHPTTVTFSPGPHPIHFHSTSSNSVYPISSTSPPGNSIWLSSKTPEYLEDTDPFYQHLLGPSEALDIDIELTAHHIQTSTLLACSDGSFNPICGEGSHGWVFSSSEKLLLLKGAGPVSSNLPISSRT